MLSEHCSLSLWIFTHCKQYANIKRGLPLKISSRNAPQRHWIPIPELWEWIFFIPFPFPNCGNGFFSFPSRSRILGIDFFIPFPFPNFGNVFFFIPFPFPNWGNGFFQFPSRSLWEWNYPFPFPFPNSQMSFLLTPGASLTFVPAWSQKGCLSVGP